MFKIVLMIFIGLGVLKMLSVVAGVPTWSSLRPSIKRFNTFLIYPRFRLVPILNAEKWAL